MPPALFASGGVCVLSAHTGAEFESGAANARHGVNDPQPGVEPEPAGPDPAERQAAPQPGQPAARRGQLNIQGNE